LIWAVLITAFTPPREILFWIAGVTILLVALLSVGKSWLRLKAVRLILTDYQSELRRQFLPQNVLWLLAPAVFLYNCVAAGLSRKMAWRNVHYELVSATQTKILGRKDGTNCI
jgi:hypothetical protein